MLYHTFVLPYMTYTKDIWFCAAETVLERVIVFQKKKINGAMNSLPFNTHNGDFFKNMNKLRANDLPKLLLQFSCSKISPVPFLILALISITTIPGAETVWLFLCIISQ